MRPYIFGARNGIHIIDLQQTVKMFRTAYDFIADTVAGGGNVIFVGTKRQAQESVKAEAERADMFYITHRWLGGTLTNFQTIKHSTDRLKKLEQMFEDGTINRYAKKEIAALGREMKKLQENLGGVKTMEKLPHAAFIIDPKREEIAVKECRKLHIPIVAVVDTNCDPDLIDYVIPGNDDAIRAIKLFVTHIADACLEGVNRREELPGGAEKPETKPSPAAAGKPAAPEAGPETVPVDTAAEAAQADPTPPAAAQATPSETPQAEPVAQPAPEPGAEPNVESAPVEDVPAEGGDTVPTAQAAEAATPETAQEAAEEDK
jgi:small subunit ribosomal protein S2